MASKLRYGSSSEIEAGCLFIDFELGKAEKGRSFKLLLARKKMQNKQGMAVMLVLVGVEVCQH